MLQIAALAALVAAVAGLYLLRPPPRRWLVPSSFIWEQVLRQSRAVVDRWRWWMSLLLACVIACLMALAAVQSPDQAHGDKGRLVLVVDDTATMATRTADGQTRFQHALGRARDLVRQNSSVLVTDTARWVSAPSFAERQTAFATLERLQVFFVREPRFPDIAQMTTEPELVRAVFITDGVALPVVPPGVEVESVFEPAFNVGITAFDVRPVPGEGTRAQALVEVSNAAPEAVPAEIEMADRRGHHAVARVSVAALQSAASLIDVSGLTADRCRHGYAVPAMRWPSMTSRMRVCRRSSHSGGVGEQRQSLPRKVLALHTAGHADVSWRQEVSVLRRKLMHGYSTALRRPSRRRSRPCFCVPPGDLAPKRGRTTATRGAAGILRIRCCRMCAAGRHHRSSRGLPATMKVWCCWRTARHLDAGERRFARVMVVGFALDESNFALQSGFPMFLANTLSWLTDEPVASHRS